MKIYFIKRELMSKMVFILLALIATITIVYGYQFSRNISTISSEDVGIYQGNTAKKSIALTFNVDWGEEEVLKILEILKENNAKATFYLTGRWTDKFPEIAKKIANEGHEIGNHSYSHPHVDNLSISKNISQIKKAEESILKITGEKPRLYAPPYGEKKPHVIKSAADAGYLTVYWTIDTIDWNRERSAEVIKDTVLSKLQNGAIVLMHPVPNTVEALPEILTELKNKGYSLETVSQILE